MKERFGIGVGRAKTQDELAKKYNFITIDCTKDNKIRTIEDINNELYEQVRKLIDG